MVGWREFWAPASFASALMFLSGASCTPDERSLFLELSASGRGDAGSSQNLAGTKGLAGESGSAGEDNASGQAGESGAAGAPVDAGGGTSQSGGGGAGGTSNGGASNGGASNGGTSGGGTSGGGTSGGGTSNAGSAGAPAPGHCGDIDGNSIDDCSETLIQNSRFDSNVEHWTSGQWNAKNARPASSSGSLLVLNDSPVVPDVGFKLIAAEQCIEVTGDLNYVVAARVLIPAGQGSGFGGFNLLIYANDGCKGTFVTGLSPASTQAVDAWTVVTAEFKMPTAARSMSVRLAATRPFSQAKLQVLFDDILVRRKVP